VLQFNQNAKKLEISKFEVELSNLKSQPDESVSEEIQRIVEAEITKAYD